MASAALLRHVADTAPDADLLRRFVAGREPDGFAELVRRHGPVVYRVCRRLLGTSSADDAFQATFLILATRPESVRKAGSVGSWLVGVAGRVARQMRKRERRFRASGGRQPPESPDPRGADAPGSPELAEQFRILDEELTRLPDRLRGPVVVCLLQGRTQEQAVAELGGSVRTVRRRLEEAKQLLRLRLERRGVVPAVAAGLAAGVGEATATTPADLSGRTVTTVFDFLAGGAAVSAPAAVIAKGVAMGTLARKVKLAMVTAAVGLTALGVGVAGDEKPTTRSPVADRAAAPPVVPVAIRNAPPSGQPVAPVGAPLGWTVTVDRPPSVRAIAAEAEHQRREIARRWLGAELTGDRLRPLHVVVAKDDEPIPPPPGGHLTILYRRGGAVGSSSTLSFADGRLVQPWVNLAGPLEDVLDNDLPRQMAHVVLAEYFGKPLPRWADQGIAALSESGERQIDHMARCRELLGKGQALRLKTLFALKELRAKEHATLTVQGRSVVQFLMSRRDVPPLPRGAAPEMKSILETNEDRDTPFVRILTFVWVGTSRGWDEAADQVYGFMTVDAMEAAWLDWEKQYASRIPPAARPAAAAPPVAPTPAKEPELQFIPPVKLPDEK
jgi:RNA polymerase sigma factor (sigma-70 family)